jgi:hypothetical protein
MGESSDGEVLSTVVGAVVAAVVAVAGFAALTAFEFGSPLLRAAFAVLLGVVAAQYYERL